MTEPVLTRPDSGVAATARRRPAAILHAQAFLWAFISTLLGPAVPLLRTELDLDYAQAGSLFSASSLGFLLGSLLAGATLHHVSGRVFAGVAATGLLLGLTGFLVARQYPLLIIAVVASGIVGGAMTTQANSGISDLFAEKRSAALSLLNVSFGAGALLAPLYASLVVAATGNWRELYLWGLIPLAILAVASVVTPLTSRPRRPKAGDDNSVGVSTSMRGLLKSRPGLLASFAVFAAAAVEWGYAYWAATLFIDAVGSTPQIATMMPSTFWGGMLAGRLFFGRILATAPPARVLSACSLLSLIACLVIATSSVFTVTAITSVVLGGSLAAVIPTLMGLLIDANPSSSGAISGLSMFASGVGSLAAPGVIGLAADPFGLSVAIWVLPLTAIVLVVLQRAVRHSHFASG